MTFVADDSSQTLAVTCADVDLCQFSQWHLHFANHSFRCQVIDAPSELLAWLTNDDGLHLADSNDLVQRDTRVDDAQDYDDDGWNDALNESTQIDSLPTAFKDRLRAALHELGGACFVKLNWSAPRDAAWLIGAHGADFKFTSVDQILMALKGSDFIAHDLQHRYEHCVDTRQDSVRLHPPLQVVLKEWRPLQRSSEFRCFVFQRQLIAMCQRNADTFYEFLPSRSAALAETVRQFVAGTVAPSAFSLNSFVCDVYVTSANKVKLIDIGPFGVMTDPILFTWSELASRCCLQASDTPVLMRVVENELGIRPSLKTVTGLPYDMTLGAVEACRDVDSLVDQLRSLR